MKNVYVFVLFMFCASFSALGQSLTTEKLTFHKWKKGTQLVCQNEDHRLVLPARSIKDKANKSRIKQVQLDGESFRLETKKRALYLKTIEGATLVSTNRKRTEIQIGKKTFYRKKRRGLKNQVEYVDEDGITILTGALHKRIIRITPTTTDQEEIRLLMIICFENILLQKEADDSANSVIQSSMM
ncbi:MAG: hypothetical protein AAF587_17645 [Bacteroidota bacterium]